MQNYNGSTIAGIGVEDFHDEYQIVPSASHPDSLKLLAFWNDHAADGVVIGRDVPSRAIASLLSHIVVWEPVGEWSNLRIRLAGAALQKRFGGDLKGRLMSEVFPPADYRRHVAEARMVIDSWTPSVVDSHIFCGRVEQYHLEILLLPVFSHDRTSPWLISGTFYFS